eukprot:jgi/Chlat1/6200/Chrsp44S05798
MASRSVLLALLAAVLFLQLAAAGVAAGAARRELLQSNIPTDNTAPPPKIEGSCKALQCPDNYTDVCRLAPLCIVQNYKYVCFYTNKKSKDGAACKKGFPNYCKDGECKQAFCFPGDATVQLENGQKIAMSKLMPGARVQTLNKNGKVVYTDVMLFHHAVNGPADGAPSPMLSIAYESEGRAGSLRLSPEHMLYTAPSTNASAVKVVPAMALKAGDLVLVESAGRSVAVEIVGISKAAAASSYYAPETMSGNLLVDGVLVSTYARPANTHEGAHMSMAPMRALYRMFPSLFSQRQTGVFWYNQMLLSIPQPVRDFLARTFLHGKVVQRPHIAATIETNSLAA